MLTAEMLRARQPAIRRGFRRSRRRPRRRVLRAPVLRFHSHRFHCRLNAAACRTHRFGGPSGQDARGGPSPRGDLV